MNADGKGGSRWKGRKGIEEKASVATKNEVVLFAASELGCIKAGQY